ncbi:hypothetical protein COEREDRAFT_80275 [Coemansia reversa NRRL 1564]|uniref:CsbD-like domain-containing protein n=1 Tax=Coemansia reversa (strain ATCC 12441 / NRRL 1564) TaxID=763665 RepID=A0A2G5BG25_COERN|nr:hypothetical protein COEREDRAFT_80275 [Coemansia reversa NRRL 1564]|eukprot:PIA17978.1 hypothetical protein COEREDRAFT_80275 [Coemansia reversa NRRL 1564]
MSNFVNQATGFAKETVGGLMGDEQMKKEGRSQRAQAIGEQEMEKSKEQRQEQVDKVMDDPAVTNAQGKLMAATGAAQKYLGKLTGNTDKEQQGHQLQAEGTGESKLSEQKLQQQQQPTTQ